MSAQDNLPLQGVVVIDLSTRLPGPLATLLMAQAGATVIKVERPPGEELRQAQPAVDGLSAHYAWLNRGKQCIALDLRDAADKTRLLKLVAGADVLVEQFRPGVMKRLGLAYEDLSALNQGLIYCAITGFGQTDPRSLEAGHDLNYLAAAGLLSASASGPRGVPALPAVLLGDIAGGTHPAVMNVLLALMQKGRTGRGQYIDIAIARNVEVFSMWNAVAGHLTHQWPAPGMARHTGGSPRYNLYAGSDGKLLAVAALEDKFWSNFLACIELQVSAQQEREQPQAVIERVAARIATGTVASWLERMRGRDTCCSPVPDLKDTVRASSRGHALPEIALPLVDMFAQPDAPPPRWITPAEEILFSQASRTNPHAS